MKKHNHSLKEVSLLIIAFNISSLLLLRTQTSCFVKIKKSLGRGNKNYFLIILNRRKGQLLGELRLQRRFRIAPFLKSQQQLKQCLFLGIFVQKLFKNNLNFWYPHAKKIWNKQMHLCFKSDENNSAIAFTDLLIFGTSDWGLSQILFGQKIPQNIHCAKLERTKKSFCTEPSLTWPVRLK